MCSTLYTEQLNSKIWERFFIRTLLRSTDFLLVLYIPVLGIRIRIFLGLPDPDSLFRGDQDPAPDPSLFMIMIKVLSGRTAIRLAK
jgi:hypothetical protein